MPAKKKIETVEIVEQNNEDVKATETDEVKETKKASKDPLDIFNPVVSTVAKGLEGKVILVYGGNNLGKAQPKDTMIPTPNGFKKLGELNVGDYVFNRLGKPVRVTQIYEQGFLDNFKVTLRDGRTTYCNDEHLWSYYTSRGNLKTVALQEMLDMGIKHNKKYRFNIPQNKPVEYKTIQYTVDPYVVGAFIGNGCTTMDVLTFSSDDEETVAEITRLINGAKYKKTSEKNYGWNFEMQPQDYYRSGSNTVINFQTKKIFSNIPEIIGKADQKRIPEQYLFGSIEQRYSLLQGLMDTDGSIKRSDFSCRYDTTSKQLAQDVVLLVNSLGMSASVGTDLHKPNPCYYVLISCDYQDKSKMFRLKRKKAVAQECLEKNNTKTHNRLPITKIEKMPEQADMRCIVVDDEEHLYLTNDYIVTHNTKQATRMEKPFYLPFEQGLNAIAGVPYCPISKWSDFIKINKQLTDPSTVKQARELYSTIIFDEVEAASNYCQEFICQKYGAVSIGSGNGGYGLWKEYETEFWKQINKLTSAGYCVYFIAHAQEKDGFISPKADKRALAPIMNLADITVYVRSNGVDKNGRVVKSSGYLAETDEFFARSRFDYLPYTEIEEFTAENLEKVIIEAIELQEKTEGIKAVTYEEQKKDREVQTKPYDELMADLQAAGGNLADNGYLEDLQIIVAQHLGEGKKANELRKGQEQVIEALIYDIEEFAREKGI